jgi:DNA-binding CsgD family transcriptional regulator
MDTRASEAFVGRARELGELERLVESAAAGSGSTVLVAGEAGIGKTRLVTELAVCARRAGADVLVGRSIDLVGTELPYQPFVEALRPLGGLRDADGPAVGSQLRLFEQALALLGDRAAAGPVLLVLEDLHWADTSTVDLVVYLAHNLADAAVLLVATYRSDEPASTDRMRRLADGVRRAGSAHLLELGPLADDELRSLLATRADAALTDSIIARSEGNPFFAEELVAAADESGKLPRRLRDLLLRRVDRLDEPTRGLLRAAAASGRDVGYPLLLAVAERPEPDVRESLRRAVEQGVLVADQRSGVFRFRHALLAEAIYATVLPGEREELHARLADELSRSGAASAAELAPHWAAAGRAPEALAASIEAARRAEALFALPEALAHLERALVLWDEVPGAAGLAQLDLAALCAWAATLAAETGAAPHAVELTRRALELVGTSDVPRAALLWVGLARYVHWSGAGDGFAECQRALELLPADKPSPERARVLAGFASTLHVAWRHAEALEVSEETVALAREVGADKAELLALDVLGSSLVYLGRTDEGLTHLRLGLKLAEEREDVDALHRAYVSLTDVLTILGRPRESAQVGATGLEVMRRYGTDTTVLLADQIEALIAIGEWEDAERLSAVAVRSITSNYPYVLLINRGVLEVGLGDFDAAQKHLDAALETLRPDRGLGIFDAELAELALWQRRWSDADDAVRKGLALAGMESAAQIRVRLCAQGLRVQAELIALARARRDRDAVDGRLEHATLLLADARSAAADASAVTPNAGGWLAVAEAEYERARGAAQPELWATAAEAWDRLERPPLATYCRWRRGEALVAAGAPRAVASVPLREARDVAAHIGARPLLREIELLAERARLDLTPPDTGAAEARDDLQELLGLTAREAEVLSLVARGLTNREIAETLVISVKTASVHVSHILRKLDAPNRREAAAIVHRLESRAAAVTAE